MTDNAVDRGSAAVGLDAEPPAGEPAERDVAASGAQVDDETLLALAEQLVAACPLAPVDDAGARVRCADALTDLPLLRDAVADPLLWGGQPAGLPLERVPTEASLTNFNPRVWRRIYLSTFMFEQPAAIERAGAYSVLRVPARFRHALDAGDYPYPFWHAEKKWVSYEQATHVIFLFEGERLIASFRSDQQDPSRPHTPRQWDGVWTWSDGEQPRATLFRTLFSEGNPFVSALDESYRALSESLREHTCTSCHSPNNPAGIKHLDILNYPNQSLPSRHRIVRMIEQNQMPPPSGIADEAARLAVLERARAFAELGDRALAFEGEPTVTDPAGAR